MLFQVRYLDPPHRPNPLALTDGRGLLIPGQRSCVVTGATVLVELALDGDYIALATDLSAIVPVTPTMLRLAGVI